MNKGALIMSEEKTITEFQAHENPMLAMAAEKGDSEMKDYLVDFVGTKLEKEEVVNAKSIHDFKERLDKSKYRDGTTRA